MIIKKTTFSSWLCSQAFLLSSPASSGTQTPSSVHSFCCCCRFLLDRPTHQHKRQSDGKRNILLWWHYNGQSSFYSSLIKRYVGIIISATSIAPVRYVKILTWLRGFLGQNCKSSPMSRNSRWFIEFLLKLRLNLCNMFCSSHNIVESNPLHWFGQGLATIYVKWLCWTKFNFHQTSSTTVFIFLHLGQFTRIRIFFESATFSFRIRLPSTRIRCIRHTNPQLFDSTLQRGNLWIRYESRIAWTLNPENVQWIFKTVPTVMLSLFLEFSFKSYNLHRPQLCHTAAWHFEPSFLTGRTIVTNWTL